MENVKVCPACQKPLEANAPDGLCPGCLMQAALGSGAGTAGAASATTKRTAFVAPPVEEVGRLFPQLEVLSFIGQGGMGAVYKVRQKALDRIVALKILPPAIGQETSFAERFTREAKALARLNHPGVVTLYEFGQADGLFFFLMEFVDGMSLRHLLDVERISPREALAIVPQICDALQYAHDQGIVHRDIKPENILLDRQGRVKVADFGLAKLVGAAAEPRAPQDTPAATLSLTGVGKVMGTPQYMAPEQREHPTAVDHRADIYSLGVVFYQMLTGELPAQQIDPPSHKVQLDVRLDEVVLRALEKVPEKRYQQASQVKTAVESINGAPATSVQTLAGSVDGSQLPRDSGGPAASLRKHRVLWAIACLMMAGLLVHAFVLAPYRATTEAVSPTIPYGSYVLVYKLARHYGPGDIVLYRHDGRRFVGRVSQAGPAQGRLLIERANEPPRAFSMTDIIGRVILNTRSEMAREGNTNVVDSFVQALPQGEVELFSVSYHPSAGKPAWHPDGAPFSAPPIEVQGCSVAQDVNHLTRELVIRLSGLPKDASDPAWQFGSGISWAGGGAAWRGKHRAAELRAVAVQLPDTDRTITFKVGVALGPWDTVAEGAPDSSNMSGRSREGKNWTVAFTRAAETDGNTQVTVTHTVKDWEVRLTAVDQNGREHTSSGSESNGTDSFVNLTATFNALARDEIKEFRFQVRPYHWVEFRGVALFPETVVEAGGNSTPASDNR